MTTTPSQVDKDSGRTDRIDTPPFTIEPGKVTRQGGTSSRTVIGFAAPATRHLDGSLEVSIYAVLFDDQGRFIARRSADRHRTVVGSRAQWFHELDNDWLAQAARITYELEYRFDHRRKILGGELPPLPAEAAGSDYFRWLNLDPRLLEDRCVRFDFALWVRSTELVITISQQPKFETESCRTEFELDFIDEDQQLAYTRSFTNSLNLGQPSFDDTSINIDRRAQRALRFFELRGRTESRGMVRLSLDVPA